jgi:hypothetical protein
MIPKACCLLLVDTVDKSNNNFEDWGVWWLLLGYSHAADLLNPISSNTIKSFYCEILTKQPFNCFD